MPTPDLIVAVSTVLAFAFSLVSLVVTIGFNRRIKQADLQDSFHGRFDRLQEVRAEILCRAAQSNPPTSLPLEANVFFSRFWSLQFDEFVAWQQGFVPDDVYRSWVFARWQQLRAPTTEWTLAGRTVGDSLDEVLKTWEPEPYTRGVRPPLVKGFLDLFAELKRAEDPPQVDRTLMKYAPNPAVLL